jgi:transposase
MRGDSTQQAIILSAITPDQLVPQDHPIRRIKPIVERVLRELSPVFRTMYAPVGRPSVPPEHLLKASLLIALFSVRSERQFCERLQYDLLFKWFLDLNITDQAFDASTFSKNRGRLLAHDVARQFFLAVRAEADRGGLLSDEHFSVDGTLLEAWASQKSYRPRDEDDPPAGGGGRNAEVDFHGEQRRRDTHVSRTDPQALLYRKGRGQPAKLCFLGHVLTENRNGLVVDVELTTATGRAEREAAQRMLGRSTTGRATVAADRGYDTRDFVAACRSAGVTPHVARNTAHRRSAIDGRTTRHGGYEQSLRRRKLVEEVFGWMKTVGGGRKLRFIGVERNRLWAEMTASAYNLVRMAKLGAATA